MITIGSPEYKVAINKELDASVEQLYALTHGDLSYLDWFLEQSPARHKELTEFPAKIQATIGILPLKAIAAAINFYLACHTLIYEAWSCRDALGLEVLARLTASGGKVM